MAIGLLCLLVTALVRVLCSYPPTWSPQRWMIYSPILFSSRPRQFSNLLSPPQTQDPSLSSSSSSFHPTQPPWVGCIIFNHHGRHRPCPCGEGPNLLDAEVHELPQGRIRRILGPVLQPGGLRTAPTSHADETGRHRDHPRRTTGASGIPAHQPKRGRAAEIPGAVGWPTATAAPPRWVPEGLVPTTNA